ncbi:MAG TPA: RagB/SusD family nutrient uptake outer membrane protein [Chryseosolibacter sp.]
MKIDFRYILKVLMVATVLSIGSGCSDFLDDADPTGLSPDNYFLLPEDAEPAVNAVYENLRFFSGGAGIFSQNFQLLDALSGTARTETAQNSDLNNLYGFTYNGDNLHLSQWWRELYEGVANANIAIEGIGKIPVMNDTQRKLWLGHAHFLRAFHYFYLVRMWGDVPLITSPIKDKNDPNMYPSRASVQEVYDVIVSDLLTAEASGLPAKDEGGRASLGAVKSLLAKVYLTMAGHPLNKGAEYYQKAADKANEVIASGTFDLFLTYNDLHLRANKNKREHIFSVQYSDAANVVNGMQPLLHPNIKDMSAYETEIGTTVPTESFFNSFEPGDRRAIDQQGYFYRSYFRGGTGTQFDLGNAYIYKHFDREASGAPGFPGNSRSDLNWPLLRFAEVLLIYAEAQNEVTGPTQPAIDAVKRIRDRAGLATPTLGSVTKEQFRELIWQERWHELCYEGITFFDMLRLRKVYNEATNSFSDFVGGTTGTGITLQEKHLLLPIPAADFRNNPNLGTNNPGW